MTTIIIDLVKRLVVSDTRATYMKNGKVLGYESGNKKIFKSDCGKFVMTTSGNCNLSNGWIKDFCKGKEVDVGGVNIWDDASILIANIYNGQIKYIYLKKKLYGVEKRIKYYTGGTFLTVGSGGDLASKLMSKLGDARRVIKYVAMKDKFTNDILQVMEY